MPLSSPAVGSVGQNVLLPQLFLPAATNYAVPWSSTSICTRTRWLTCEFLCRLFVHSRPPSPWNYPSRSHIVPVASILSSSTRPSVVQSFMGDRKARLSLPDYGSIIVHRALNTASLRDEIFAQLCKQTTANPDMWVFHLCEWRNDRSGCEIDWLNSNWQDLFASERAKHWKRKKDYRYLCVFIILVLLWSR